MFHWLQDWTWQVSWVCQIIKYMREVRDNNENKLATPAEVILNIHNQIFIT